MLLATSNRRHLVREMWSDRDDVEQNADIHRSDTMEEKLSLANRFGALYPEFKDEIKMNIAKYGEFLPETFFLEHGNAKVLDVIKNGTDAEQKRLFKMLGEIYEDGTNEVQDIIGVTILGEMKNDKEMMAVADKYMTEYMAGPVHEVNKITAKKNSLTKKLANPPVYKPKKNKKFSIANALNQQQQ